VVQPSILDLNLIVADVSRMLRRLIGENIELVTMLDKSPGLVLADSGQMHQVLMNLAVNARDAMPRGGRLTIGTASVHLEKGHADWCENTKPGSYVQLVVSDTGTGMTENTLAHLFEPFFTTKQTGSGTGLGLAIVYGVIRQSGGFVSVSSVRGEGTAFRVYLPRADESLSARELSPQPDASLRGTETVLVVEDQQEVRQLVCQILKSYGYEVLESANAGEACLTSQRFAGPIRLMLTDVVMPGISGCDLARKLKPLRPEMGVLFMSGYSDQFVADEELAPGDAYIGKPFSPEGLARKVRQMFKEQEK
jgi:CheY-like chemotaxis protein